MSKVPIGAPLAESQRRFAAPALHRALGLRLVSAGEGRAVIALDVTAASRGGVGGSVHGGILAAMVDIAMLEALITVLAPSDVPAGTADLALTYLRPALGTVVTAEASILKKGRQLVVAEVEIRDERGQLCAKGRTLYALRGGTAP